MNKKVNPPRRALQFLSWFCDPDLLPEIEGDLHELFQRWVKQYGVRKARWLYWLNILSFFRPFALKRKNYVLPIISFTMLENYFLTAWRQVEKNKVHTAINVSGLAIGMAACLMISLTVQHEFSYDRHHPDGDRIYRITSHSKSADDWFPNGGVPAPVPLTIRDEFTGLNAVAALHTVHPTEVKLPQGPNVGEQKHLVIAGPNYFDIFSHYEWIIGNPAQSLTKPYQVVLTESQARKYFGQQEAVGQIITYFDSLDFVVSGILADVPHQTDLFFTDYLSFATLLSNQVLAGNYGLESWQSTNSSSLAFLKLSEGTTPADIEQQFPALIEKYINQGENNQEKGFNLQPLSDIHFNADYPLDRQRVAHKPTLYGLALAALFLLLIASINFINLETARAVLRSREVGVRKVLGSSRWQLIQQFLGETFLITLLAGGMAILLSKLGMDYFRESLPPDLSLNALWNNHGWLLLLAIVGVVSLLAGTYPALVLSYYAPAFALKNQVAKMAGTTRKAYLRKSLIIFQFAIAQAFILGTLLVASQLHFLLNKDMGFRKDAVVHFQAPNFWQDTTQRRITLANELRELSGVSALSLSNMLPASQGWSSRTVTYQRDISETKVNIYIKQADTSFLEVYGIELLAGRSYHYSDTLNELLLNETAAKAFGFDPPTQAVGQLIQLNKNSSLPVVGVVRDFHDGPLYEKIHPIMMGSSDVQRSANFNILLASRGKQGEEVKGVIAQIEQVFKQFYPEEPFEYQFYDDTIANFYETEQRTAGLINVATGLGIFISCLGLLGLASFTTNQRIKEIGIRKVLGATAAQLVVLFTREFIWLVLISFIIAAPLAWYFGSEWLNRFAYRTNIGLAIFLLTMLSALVLALLTVGLRSWHAALANPVDSLRNE